MPIFRFTHGDDVRDLDIGTMLMSEAESCESLTGWTEQEWRMEIAESRVQAIRFAWWLAGKRVGVDERYSSIDLDLRKLNVEAIRAEGDDPLDEPEDEDGPEVPTGPGDDRAAVD